GLVGQANLLFIGLLGPQAFPADIIPLTLVCCLLPAAIFSLVMFDYGHSGNMLLAESGCSAWLLRMPIHSWKIAVVPIVLRTLWISILWLTMAISLQLFPPNDSLPRLAPCLCLSAASIWLLVI